MTVRVDLVIASYRLGTRLTRLLQHSHRAFSGSCRCRFLPSLGSELHSCAQQHNNDHGAAAPVNYHLAERITTRVFRRTIVFLVQLMYFARFEFSRSYTLLLRATYLCALVQHMHFVPRPTPFSVLRSVLTIIRGSGRTVLNGEGL